VDREFVAGMVHHCSTALRKNMPPDISARNHERESRKRGLAAWRRFARNARRVLPAASFAARFSEIEAGNIHQEEREGRSPDLASRLDANSSERPSGGRASRLRRCR
jgi:hypothetical protein